MRPKKWATPGSLKSKFLHVPRVCTPQGAWSCIPEPKLFLSLILSLVIMQFLTIMRSRVEEIPWGGRQPWRKGSCCLLVTSLCPQRAKQRGTWECRALLQLGSGEVLVTWRERSYPICSFNYWEKNYHSNITEEKKTHTQTRLQQQGLLEMFFL